MTTHNPNDEPTPEAPQPLVETETHEIDPQAISTVETLPPEVYTERRSSAGRALLGCLAVVVLLVLLVGVLPTLLGINVLSGFMDTMNGILNPTPVVNVSSTRTVLSGIQPLGQLVSISAQLAKADIEIGVQQGGLNACGFSSNHVAQGTIEGGIDLSKLSQDDVVYDEEQDVYVVTLPAPQLTSCRIDFIRQYARSTTVCNVDWDEARLLAQYMALRDFRDDALEGGILDRAKLEARLVVGNFVYALTGETARIEFHEEETTTLPASCIPQTPDGWTYDEAQNAWTQAS